MRSLRLRRLAVALFAFAATIDVLAQVPQTTPASQGPTGPRTGMIVGQVVDSSGVPVPEAIVRLTMPKFDFTAPLAARGRVMADAEGRFFFADLPAGEYWFGATKEGYTGGIIGQRRLSDGQQLLSLAEGERRTDVKLTLWKYAVISGTVVDEAGEPVVGVMVNALVRNIVAGRTQYAQMHSAPWLLPKARTDDRGRFRLAQLTPGSYVVVTPQMHTTAPVSVLNTYQQNYNFLTELLSVTEPNGSNDWRADMANTGVGQSRTEQVGDFALISMSQVLIPPPATRDGRRQMYRTVYYPAASSASAATLITLDSGEERTDVNITMRPVPAVRLSGRIVMPDGKPPAPMAIRLVGESARDVGDAGFEAANGMSDTSGRFTLLGVPPGDYVLKSAKVRFGLEVQRGEPTFFGQERIIVGDRDIDDFVLTMHPTYRIEGRAEFWTSKGQLPGLPQGAAVQRVIFFPSAFGDQETLGGATISDDGHFFLAGGPGRYVVQTSESGGWFVQSVTLNGKDITDRAFDLQSDATSFVVKYTDRPAKLTGNVTDARGNASPSAIVLAFTTDPTRWSGYGPSPRLVKSAMTSQKGAYSFSNLPPGDYFVVAISTDDSENWTDPKNLESFSRQAARLTMTAETAKTLDLTLKPIR